MKTIAFIPARYAATRFPAKLMQLLGDKTVILHTYDNTVARNLFDEVIVVTDSDIIFNEIIHHGGKAIMSKKHHESGSDRIAEAVVDMDVDIIVNVQGDEPFTQKESLQKLLKAFDSNEGINIHVASLMHKIKEKEAIENPSNVKVVVDKNFDALFFSRSVIPYNRNNDMPVIYYKHIGIYAFRKQALMNFTKWPASALEKIEKLEQLRYLENGVSIRMVLTDEVSISIDTPEDLEQAKRYIK
ncbi:MAG: 3-deoxy-manno-octulosonate cytidylyltransferase [Parafilimonas sp.]